ncbi:hypothetical protein OROMI_003786 [Orobanche minor]
MKVLWYFPLNDRLERIFMSPHTAKAMRWHVEPRVTDDDTMIHPSDGEAWKHIDREFPGFAADVRNVRLGLASDGFNPFGNMSLSYSIWPVVIVPYNLPPWMCMKKEYNMLTLLVPGPGYPGKCIDVYLRPLIEELKFLWEQGHPTYDSYSHEMFYLRAMCTINDFPAYGMLSGSVISGYRGCPVCLNADCARYHCRKDIRMRHRLWLERTHVWRMDVAAFDGTEEVGDPPREWTGDEILAVLNEYDYGQLSNHPDIVAAILERPDRYKYWSHKSIFWDLPYWSKLLIRNYLDVMHIEKNICESVVGTVLCWEGKTTDDPKARIGLKEINIRKHLWLKEGKGKHKMPKAAYTVTPEQEAEIFSWMKAARYPSGYAGNIGRCVNFKENKLTGLKSHDCHILLQRFFPVFIRPYLSKQVVEPCVSLSRFFQKLVTREVRKSDLHLMQKEIIYILCKFERIFPPIFFDLMPHLMIHLPRQLLLTGPVHYTWMFPIERQLGEYKDSVTNKSAPEGCIDEAYIAWECVTYTKFYLGAMDPTPEPMSTILVPFNLSIITNEVEVQGRLHDIHLQPYELQIAHWWILLNCPEVQHWKDIHLSCDAVNGDLRFHNEIFADYFGQWVSV